MQVILLGFLELADLVPAEGAVVKGFEMLSVQLNGRSIIGDSIQEVSLLTEGKATVVIEICLGGLQVYGFSEGENSLVKVTFSVKTYAFVVISESIVWVYGYGCGVILYR